MEIIREYVQPKKAPRKIYNRMFIITTNTRAASVSHIQKLVRLAKKDFPKLKVRDIEIRNYVVGQGSGFLGIMWFSNKKPPKDYEMIRNPHLIK